MTGHDGSRPKRRRLLRWPLYFATMAGLDSCPMKPLFLALLLVLSLSTASAQKRKSAPLPEPCTVTIDQVPLIRGLRLGQPYDQLQPALPRRLTFDRPDEYGIRRVWLSPSFLISPEQLAGIESVLLIYFDDSLVDMEINYKNEVPWQSNLHFVAAIADQLRLPRTGWQQRDPSYLVCRGFVVKVAHATVMPTIELFSAQVSDEIAKRKAEVEEKKRGRFRP